jgi:uncharacterized protein involved in exopolysaccharide biosynthesis
MVTENEESTFNSSALLVFLYKWKRPLLLVCGAAFVLSTIISFLITPKYKSTVVLFPATTSSVSKALLTDDNNADQDILKFGKEEQAEQMLQILNSDEIRDKIAKKFDLLHHYDIDTTDRYKTSNLYDEYEDNISFERTEFMSVKINVLDKDPDMAAKIANEITNLLDSVHTRMQRDRSMRALNIIQGEYTKLQDEVKDLDDSLKYLREMGINDYETQASVFNEQYATALAKGNDKGVKALEEKLGILSKYGGLYVRLRESLNMRLYRLNIVKTKLQEIKIDTEQSLPHKFVVNKAYKSERKAYPIRWLIVLISTLTTFFLAVLILMVIENFIGFKLKPFT